MLARSSCVKMELSELMVACIQGNLDYVKDLLEVPGIQIELQNKEGWHALMYTCAHGNVQVAQLILNA